MKIKVSKLQNTICYPDMELALYSTANVEKPHINLLHVTPMMKNPTKELPKESYYVRLNYQNETYVLDTSNHQYLPKTRTLVGAKFWNQETGEIILGKEGLRLSVVKPVGKGAPEEHEMRQVRGTYLEFPVRFRFFSKKKFEFFGFFGFHYFCVKTTVFSAKITTFLLKLLF